MSNTFNLGDRVFVVADTGTYFVECKIVTIRASGVDYVVEPISDHSLSIHDRIKTGDYIFRDKDSAIAEIEKNRAFLEAATNAGTPSR